MTDAELLDEQFVLAHLLDAPRDHAWELAGLQPAWFRDRHCRLIAASICRLRDAGRSIDYRRVGRMVGRAGSPARTLVHVLRIRAGIDCGLTAAISRLQFRAGRRAA